MIETIVIILFAIGVTWLFTSMYRKSKKKNTKKAQDIYDYIEDMKSNAANTNDITVLRRLYCESYQYRCKVIPKEKEHLEQVFKYIKEKIDELTKLK